MTRLLALAPLAVVAACAQAPDKIVATSVSPALYSGQTCGQMQAEAARINSRLSTLTGAQQSRASRDNTMVAVGMFLFWPSLFFVGQGQDHATEIAQLRGEAEALAHAARQRGC